MKYRVFKRKQSRRNKSVRRGLVHAAGCTEPNCASKYWKIPDILEEVENEFDGQISVPRSLRKTLGRFL
jgi:hypothetical protein